MTATPQELTVRLDEAGKRLDRLLSDRELGWSRSTLQRWIEEGRVLVDGLPCRARDRARGGSKVEVHPAPPPPSEAIPQDIPLDVEFEDGHLLVVHKPAGMVVHPAPGHADGTLVNALRFHTEIRGGDDPRRPGIVHRIDRETSGLLVIAKTDAAREGLIAQFKLHDIQREYAAIVQGSMASAMTFDTLHGRHPGDRKRFSGRVTRGKRAVTHVEPIAQQPDATLVRCRLQTGRTHQIRVHLSEAGFPLLADSLYGRRSRVSAVAAVETTLGRMALHAGVLGFTHPITAQVLRFERPPPADFLRAQRALFGQLGSHSTPSM